MFKRDVVAQELVDVARLLAPAKERRASTSILDEILSQRDLLKLEDEVDEQTWDLAVETYMALGKALQLSNNQWGAFNRLRQSVDRASSMGSDLHRNNIFKAAHALGIKLPSSSF